MPDSVHKFDMSLVPVVSKMHIQVRRKALTIECLVCTNDPTCVIGSVYQIYSLKGLIVNSVKSLSKVHRYINMYASFLVFIPVLVGKTSLITRFMYDSFDSTYQVIHHVVAKH